MVAIEKILEKIVSGKSDDNVPFEDLRKLLLRMGFVERTIRKSPYFQERRG